MRVIRVFPAPGQPTGGNPAPVWLDADGLTVADMQARTYASGHESAFVLRPSGPGHDLRLQYFVPLHEMEMCGHATIGALWLLHSLGRWDGAPIKIETLSGTVHGRYSEGQVEISQPRAVIESVDDETLRIEIARCLRVAPEDIIGTVLNSATSRVKTLIQLPGLTALHEVCPDYSAVGLLCERLGSTGLYPFAMQPGSGAIVSARQFPKASGYPEDAATGIAATALAWGLRHIGLVESGSTLVTVRQGEAMGSPSEISVRLPMSAEKLNDVCWLRGNAVEMQVEQARHASH